MLMVTWNFGFLEIWVAQELGSVKLKLVPTVWPPQLVHWVPALILTQIMPKIGCCTTVYGRYFQHAHFIPIVGVGKRGEYYLVHGDMPRQHSFGTTLRFTGPVPADSRQ